MIIEKKTGNLNKVDLLNRKIDWLELEWFEANKRILRKKTTAGTEIVFRSLDKDPEFTDGDILFADEEMIIAATILLCEVIVIKPVSMFEMASACYEIGNKHAPLFYEDNELLVPFELPLLRSLQWFGFEVRQEQRKLLQRLRTTVAAYALINSDTIISRLTKQTTDE